MRVSVYCSSAKEIPQHSLDLAFEIGAAIGNKGWELVWGGGKASMMGKVAEGARSVGAKTIGVIPQSLINLEFEDKDAHEMHVVTNMRTRKAKLEELSDAFIALPGGIGTLEEFFEIWVGHYLKFHTKPVVILDPFGIYKPLHELIVHLEDEKFIKPGMREIVQWTTNVEDALKACGA